MPSSSERGATPPCDTKIPSATPPRHSEGVSQGVACGADWARIGSLHDDACHPARCDGEPPVAHKERDETGSATRAVGGDLCPVTVDEGRQGTEGSLHNGLTVFADDVEAEIEDCLAHCVVALGPAPRPPLSPPPLHHRHTSVWGEKDGVAPCGPCPAEVSDDAPGCAACCLREASREGVATIIAGIHVERMSGHDDKDEEGWHTVNNAPEATVTAAPIHGVEDGAVRENTPRRAALGGGRRDAMGQLCAVLHQPVASFCTAKETQTGATITREAGATAAAQVAAPPLPDTAREEDTKAGRGGNDGGNSNSSEYTKKQRRAAGRAVGERVGMQYGREHHVHRLRQGRCARRDVAVQRALLRIWPPSLRAAALQHYDVPIQSTSNESTVHTNTTTMRASCCSEDTRSENEGMSEADVAHCPAVVPRTSRVAGASAVTRGSEEEGLSRRRGEGEGREGEGGQTCALPELLCSICEDKMYLYAASVLTAAARHARRARHVPRPAMTRHTSSAAKHRSCAASGRPTSELAAQHDRVARHRSWASSRAATDAAGTTRATLGDGGNVASGEARWPHDHSEDDDEDGKCDAAQDERQIRRRRMDEAALSDDDDGQCRTADVGRRADVHNASARAVLASRAACSHAPTFRPVCWCGASARRTRTMPSARVVAVNSAENDTSPSSSSSAEEEEVTAMMMEAVPSGTRMTRTMPMSSSASLPTQLSSSSPSLPSQKGAPASRRTLGWFRSEQERQRMAQHIMSSGKLRHECPEVFALLCARAAEARATHAGSASHNAP